MDFYEALIACIQRSADAFGYLFEVANFKSNDLFDDTEGCEITVRWSPSADAALDNQRFYDALVYSMKQAALERDLALDVVSLVIDQRAAEMRVRWWAPALSERVIVEDRSE